MYVGVKYYKGQDANGEYYGGCEYTYQTDMNLKVGDKVIAPTVKEPRQRAIISAIRLPKPAFTCKSIAELDMQQAT